MNVIPIDILTHSLDIHRDLSVTGRVRKNGPTQRIDSMSVAIITMEQDAPHGGKMHPDGDEILYVISGKLQLIAESSPAQPLVLNPGDACIVKKGEWHKVQVLDITSLVHITPGPNGEHRPLDEEATLPSKLKQ